MITIYEASLILGCAKATVYNWTKSGILHAQKTKGVWMLDREEVVKLSGKKHPCPFCGGDSIEKDSARKCLLCGFSISGESHDLAWDGLEINTRVGNLKRHIRGLIHSPHAKIGVEIR